MLQKVTVNGTAYLVDAETKAAAKKFGASKLQVEVVPATAADLEGINLAEVPVIAASVKKAAAPATEGQTAA